MQRELPVRRRQSRVRSRSPIPVHYIDLTADSPIVPNRRHANDNEDIKTRATVETDQGAPSQRTETIEIPDTPEPPEPPRFRISRKQNKNTRTSIATMPPNDSKDKEADEDPGERLPAVNDSFDGLTPTVLSCPICYEDLRSSRKPMTTKCGHLFCEACIQATLRARKKCPVCMASITIKSCIRLHF